MLINIDHVKSALETLYQDMEMAQQENRLPGYIDDRMFELQENEPGFFALLQHMLAQVPEDCDADTAAHLISVLAFVVYRLQSQS